MVRMQLRKKNLNTFRGGGTRWTKQGKRRKKIRGGETSKREKNIKKDTRKYTYTQRASVGYGPPSP